MGWEEAGIVIKFSAAKLKQIRQALVMALLFKC
jgi:hypothetical protein